MTRQTFVFDKRLGELVPAADFYRRKWQGVKVSDLPRPMVISDNLDDTLNMADGKRYSSKAKYYKAVRAAGCEIIGSEQPSAAPRKQLDDPINDIRHAVETVKGRRSRG